MGDKQDDESVNGTDGRRSPALPVSWLTALTAQTIGALRARVSSFFVLHLICVAVAIELA